MEIINRLKPTHACNIAPTDIYEFQPINLIKLSHFEVWIKCFIPWFSWAMANEKKSPKRWIHSMIWSIIFHVLKRQEVNGSLLFKMKHWHPQSSWNSSEFLSLSWVHWNEISFFSTFFSLFFHICSEWHWHLRFIWKGWVKRSR